MNNLIGKVPIHQSNMLVDNGEMCKMIDEFDWFSTAVGERKAWPSSLVIAVNILLNSKFPMFIFWGEDLIQFYNDAYRPSLGEKGKHPKALGQKGEECWPEIWDAIKPQIDQVLGTGIPTSNIDQLLPIFRNGKLENVYWTYSYSPLYIDANTIGGVLVTCSETTLHITAQQRLQLLSDLAIQANQGNSVAQICSSANAIFCQYHEHIPFSLIYLLNKEINKLELTNHCGLNDFTLCSPEFISKSTNDDKNLWPVWDVLASGTPFKIINIKEIFDEIDDSFLEISSQACIIPLVNSNSNIPVGILIVGLNSKTPLDQVYENFLVQLARTITEIIERKQAQEREIIFLRQAERERIKLLNLFNEIPALICILKGPNHVYEMVNPCYQTSFGNRKFINNPIKEVFPEMGNEIYTLLDNVYNSGETYIGNEVPIMIFNEANSIPTQRYFNLIYKATFDNNENIDGIIVFAYDVTKPVLDRINLEESKEILKKQNIQLQKINNDLDNFIYIASHDLKAPILNIEGLKNALLEVLDENITKQPELTDIAELINKSIIKFKHTISDLTEITKVQKNFNDCTTNINVLKIINHVLEDMAIEIQMSQASVLIDIDSSHQFLFSEINFKSVIYNILNNALKYHDPKRVLEIKINSDEDEDHFIIAFNDNGLGMKLDNNSKIFSMFKRLHDHVEGTGVGLYLVKRIMDNSNGKVEVESKVGVGSVFKLYFIKDSSKVTLT